jgi:hypothetical protein
MACRSGAFRASIGVVVGVAVGLASLGVGAPAAFAAGNAGLSKLIIANPVPGWDPEPASSLSAVAASLDTQEAQYVVPQNGRALTAVQGWRDPANPARNVIIVLVALGFNGQSAAAVNAQARSGAIAALTSLCAGLATKSSVQASTIPQIPSSHTLTCTLIKDGSQPLAAGWARGDTFALVLTTQASMNAQQLTLIAGTEYLAMPTRGFAVATPGSSSSGLGTALELAAGAVVLAAAGWVVFQILRRGNHAARKPTDEVPVPEVRRGVVQRPASLAGGVGASAKPSSARPGPGSGPAPGPGASSGRD